MTCFHGSYSDQYKIPIWIASLHGHTFEWGSTKYPTDKDVYARDKKGNETGWRFRTECAACSCGWVADPLKPGGWVYWDQMAWHEHVAYAIAMAARTLS